MYSLGYDIGTRFVKICLVNDGIIDSFRIFNPGRDLAKSIRDAGEDLFSHAGIKHSKVRKNGATGFGSQFVRKKSNQYSTARCLARAAGQWDSSLRTVIDVGGLFITIAEIGSNGTLIDSLENEKCAAGSGKFLETVTGALGLSFGELSAEIYRSETPVVMTNNCAVFAESELVTMVNRGERREDILHGLISSRVSKIITMMGIMGITGPVALTGGVAQIDAFCEIFTRESGSQIISLPEDCRITAAYGAALMAAEEE